MLPGGKDRSRAVQKAFTGTIRTSVLGTPITMLFCWLHNPKALEASWSFAIRVSLAAAVTFAATVCMSYTRERYFPQGLLMLVRQKRAMTGKARSVALPVNAEFFFY